MRGWEKRKCALCYPSSCTSYHLCFMLGDVTGRLCLLNIQIDLRQEIFFFFFNGWKIKVIFSLSTSLFLWSLILFLVSDKQDSCDHSMCISVSLCPYFCRSGQSFYPLCKFWAHYSISANARGISGDAQIQKESGFMSSSAFRMTGSERFIFPVLFSLTLLYPSD